jgi:hypothetical protein
MNSLNCRARAVLVLLLALAACAQLVHAQGVPTQPYTAEFKTTHVQTLANGTTITRETKEVMARDSQGRTMNETTRIPDSPDQPAITFVNVSDDVNHTQSNWNSDGKRVRVMKMPPDRPRGTCWSTISPGLTMGIGPMPPPPPPPAPAAVAPGGGGMGAGGVAGVIFSGPAQGSNAAPIRPVHEDLGTDTIMGVEVRGYRITRTTPAGRIGNDRPLVSTTETWMAPSLGLAIRQITDDPQTGKMTREVVSLDLSEPDPSVFQPPADYEVITEEMHEVPCAQAH